MHKALLIFPTIFILFCNFVDLQAYAEARDLCLCIGDMEGKTVFKRAMKEGDGFAIRFTHSVALTPVTDYYKIIDGSIYLDKTEYQDFGAGLPHNPEGEEKMRTEHGKIIIEGFNRKLPEFDVRVGRVASHRLLLFPGQNREEELALDTVAAPGAALHFYITEKCADAGN